MPNIVYQKEYVFAPGNGSIISVIQKPTGWEVVFLATDGTTKTYFTMLAEVYVTNCMTVIAGQPIGATKKGELDISHVHYIGDKNGLKQFSFGIDETIRFEGECITFDAVNKKIIFACDSTPASDEPLIEIKFTVGKGVGVPTEGQSVFILKDCAGNLMTQKKITFYRERDYQHDKNERDYKYNPLTAQVEVTIPFEDEEDCVFECSPIGRWIICDIIGDDVPPPSECSFPYDFAYDFDCVESGTPPPVANCNFPYVLPYNFCVGT